MTLYDLIMAEANGENTRDTWRSLGRGEITDPVVIQRLLAEGYGAVAPDGE